MQTRLRHHIPCPLALCLNLESKVRLVVLPLVATINPFTLDSTQNQHPEREPSEIGPEDFDDARTPEEIYQEYDEEYASEQAVHGVQQQASLQVHDADAAAAADNGRHRSHDHDATPPVLTAKLLQPKTITSGEVVRVLSLSSKRSLEDDEEGFSGAYFPFNIVFFPSLIGIILLADPKKVRVE